MNYICSWLCADEEGAESLFPQTGKKSSGKEHQDIYWRCLIVYFITSKRFNKSEKHLLFTNVKHLPSVDGINVHRIFNELDIEIIFTDFKYKTPPGYYRMFQNQFYEFSILEYITINNKNADDLYLITDADCIFLKPVKDLFDAAKPDGILSFKDDVLPDYVINGLSRNDLKQLYEELLNEPLQEIPPYHLGEFLLSSVSNIRLFFDDFKMLWPQLLQRNEQGLKKFNEEAHTLSYLYFKNGFRPSETNIYLKRVWTNPVFYRDVEASDVDRYIWHLPSEKTFGLRKLYNFFINRSNYAFDISHKNYTDLVQKTLGVPHLTLRHRLQYYWFSISRALSKRIGKMIAFSSKPKKIVASPVNIHHENSRVANNI